MDSNLTQRRRGLEEKIPDIRKTLSMVEYLRDRRVRYWVWAAYHRRSRSLFLFFFPEHVCSLTPITLSVARLFLPSLRKGKIGQRRIRAQAKTMTPLMTSMRMDSRRVMRGGSPNLSGRPLSLPTRSTPRQSSKKRIQCSYGSEYVLCPFPFSFRHLDHFKLA